MKKLLIRISTVALIVFLLVWGISVLKCEILTYKYGDQFEERYQDTNMISSIDYIKVLSYTDDAALVYYVLEDKAAGCVLEFYEDNGKWSFGGWDAVWSKSGSADGFIWPYIR